MFLYLMFNLEKKDTNKNTQEPVEIFHLITASTKLNSQVWLNKKLEKV